MNNKKLLLTLFIVVALVQLYVPAKMIWDKENVLNTGITFKFKTAPIDPVDPFRGKYITLNFDENTFVVQNADEWYRGETVFVFIKENETGFAKISDISKTEPTNSENYLKAKIAHTSNSKSIVYIDYPFNRYYMEESKAYDAELAYRQTQQQLNKTTYALVSIKKGDAVLKDVLIDGMPIKEIVKQNQGLKNEY